MRFRQVVNTLAKIGLLGVLLLVPVTCNVSIVPPCACMCACPNSTDSEPSFTKLCGDPVQPPILTCADRCRTITNPAGAGSCLEVVNPGPQ